MPDIRGLVTAVRYLLRRQFIASPYLYVPYTRWKLEWKKIDGAAVPGPDTELLIEAYPRSGNSFAYQAFKSAQTMPVRVAHHTHAPACVLYASSRSIPSLVIIRQPRDAVLSNVVFHPDMTIRMVLEDYVDFYTTIRPVRDSIVLAKFESVTGDFGQVIDTVNRKFSTSFSRFEHDFDGEHRIFGVLEERNIATRGSMDHTRLSRPSEVRSRLKEENAKLYETPVNRRYREAAEAVYEEFAGTADV